MQNHTRSRRVLTTLALTVGYSLAASATVINGTVTRNVDGDTMWVEQDDTRKPLILKIRMLGLDAAESCFPVQATGGCVGQGHFGEDAKRVLAQLAPVGRRVKVDLQGTDVYQRALGRIFVKNIDIDLKMIRLGAAIPYIICTGENCDRSFFKKEKVADYLDDCHLARTKGLGLWNPADPLKEMPFEFRLRMSGRDPDKYVGDFETGELFDPADYKKVDVCNRIFFPKLADAEAAGFEFKK